MQIITEKFPEKLSVSDIARKLHICPDYLSKILRNEVGCSAQTLITKKRMMQARYLLLQKPYKKLTDVAILCGYNDYVFFCKHFHKYNGLSPNAYRKQAELNILTMPDF
jgi:two-component system response regulator YesN